MGIRSSGAVFGAVVFCGVIWFLYVGTLAHHATPLMGRISFSSAGTFKHSNSNLLSGRENRLIHHHWDLNYVSKRRVPNGPDPIHNRRASQSREPPGRF